MRVCASTLMRLPLAASHSTRTGTREFMRLPRRFSRVRASDGHCSRVLTDIFAPKTPMLELRTGAVNSTGAKQLSAVSSVAPARRFLRALIVNADDLGWSEGVNRGIAGAHRQGIVTSASLLANGAAFARAAELARSEARLGIGVHLNLSDGPPELAAGEVPSLVDAQGTFFAGPGRLFLRRGRGGRGAGGGGRGRGGRNRKGRDAGISPTHLDGHKHVHMLPGLFETALRLAA